MGFSEENDAVLVGLVLQGQFCSGMRFLQNLTETDLGLTSQP